MAKFLILRDVRVQTLLGDNARTGAGEPDPYLVFKSHHATVGDHSGYVRNSKTPTFEGPFKIYLGGSAEPEQIQLQVWDFDGGDGAMDDFMESVLIDFASEPAENQEGKEWALSSGGKVSFKWKITQRNAPGPAGDFGKLTIKRLAAEGVLKMDSRAGEQSVDPYMILTGKSVPVQVKWATKNGQDSPVWDEVKELAFDPMGYSLEVWDEDQDDVAKVDDLAGTADLMFEVGDDKDMTVSLVLGWRGQELNAGQVKLTYTLVLEPEGSEKIPSKPKPPDPPKVVTRKEIRKMPREEQERFVAALKKLMENKNGPQTSEYFRIAGYHGWPNDYCHHGQETFPGWHRGYLCELERALIKADVELGNDGDLGVPYWDWTIREVNGEVMPRIIREEFKEMPQDLVEPSEAGSLARTGFSRISDERALAANIESSRAAFAAEQCLTVAEHWVHASTRWRRGFSVETPHNSLHVACGFPMTSVRYAAFHPIFFLHHSQVDRIYEKHLQMETPEESASEFAMRQGSLAEQGESNRFLTPLAPFDHPLTGRPLMPADTVDAKAMGFQYDELPPDPVMQVREEPVYAAFMNVRVLDLKCKSYMLHVFVVSQADAASWKAPIDGPASWCDAEDYAGCGAIFGGKGKECKNCVERDPLVVLVEVQSALSKLGLSRHEAALRVMCVDEEGEIMPLESTPVEPPTLVGPAFEDIDVRLRCDGRAWSKKEGSGEVRALQHRLKFFGYYSGKVDGKFGPTTESAVKAFQSCSKLPPADGVADSRTKKQLLAPRHDLHPDLIPKKKRSHRGRRFKDGETVYYAVARMPGYLRGDQQSAALDEIADAFAQWGEAMGITFKWSPTNLRAAVIVNFADLTPLGEELDGLARRGGQLAEATAQKISLDAAERWLLRGQEAPRNIPEAVRFYPVLLHEIGHFLGLKHSVHPQDVMWPYYRSDPQRPQLSDADKERARARVDVPGQEPRMVPTSEATQCCTLQ